MSRVPGLRTTWGAGEVWDSQLWVGAKQLLEQHTAWTTPMPGGREPLPAGECQEHMPPPWAPVLAVSQIQLGLLPQKPSLCHYPWPGVLPQPVVSLAIPCTCQSCLSPFSRACWWKRKLKGWRAAAECSPPAMDRRDAGRVLLKRPAPHLWCQLLSMLGDGEAWLLCQALCAWLQGPGLCVLWSWSLLHSSPPTPQGPGHSH